MESVYVSVSLEALLGRGGRAIRHRQRHHAVPTPQMSLQGLLIGRLQALEQLLGLTAEVSVVGPVTPVKVEGSTG